MTWVTRGSSARATATVALVALASSCSSEEPAADGNTTSTNTSTTTTSSASASGPTSTGSSSNTVTSSSTGTGTSTGTSSTSGTTGVGGATATGSVSTGGQGAVTTGVGGTSGGTGGTDTWWFSGPRTPPTLGTWPPPNIKLTEVSSATQPTAISAPRADNSRLYFAEKWGVIRLIKDGSLLPDAALDIRDEVLEGGPSGNGMESPNQGKRGLVGLTFDPYFEQNGYVYVMYTADQGTKGEYGTPQNRYDDGDMTIARYTRSAGNPDTFDPASATIIVQWDKGNCDQCSQHNGGALEIGVDGFLWASTGDPPPYSDPGSQDLMSLNGKILRFDISSDTVTPAGNYPNADPMVWSIGIRNAYKFSVDRFTGDLFIADVGENDWEELTVEPYNDGHRDHGWPKMEATHFAQAQSCGADNCIDPVFEYRHTGSEGTAGADNCIIGGYVYRGAAIPALQGAYIYGDFGSGKLRAVQVVNGANMGGGVQEGMHQFNVPNVFMGCFGEDAAGELYVCDYEGNKILRIDAE